MAIKGKTIKKVILALTLAALLLSGLVPFFSVLLN